MSTRIARETKVTRGMGASIPAEVRKRLGIEPGDVLVWELAGSSAVVRAKKRRLRTFADFKPYDIGHATNAAEDHDEVF